MPTGGSSAWLFGQENLLISEYEGTPGGFGFASPYNNGHYYSSAPGSAGGGGDFPSTFTSISTPTDVMTCFDYSPIYTALGSGWSLNQLENLQASGSYAGDVATALIGSSGSDLSFTCYSTGTQWNPGIYTFQALVFFYYLDIVGFNDPSSPPYSYTAPPGGLAASLNAKLFIFNASNTSQFAEVTPGSGDIGCGSVVFQDPALGGDGSYNNAGSALISGWFNSRNFFGSNKFYPGFSLTPPIDAEFSTGTYDKGMFKTGVFFDGAFIR